MSTIRQEPRELNVSRGSATPHAPPVLETKHLSLSYRDKTVFRDIDLKIRPNEITALIGPSGCGKTSFLTCLNRLVEMVECAKIQGEVLFYGRNILSPAVDTIELRRKVGMIFQKPNPFPFSIWKNLELPLREKGLKDKRDISDRCFKALEDVGLLKEVKDRLHFSALNLSGGQQQRLCMARALVLQPDVLLMDEPCSALDPLSSGLVEDLIVRLKETTTVLIVTHNIAQARRIADEVAFCWVVDGVGCLVENGRCQKIFEEPAHELTSAYVSGIRG